MVNTFLPYSNYEKCARALDNRRLGKQRVEAKQIIDIIENYDKVKAWRNHPVVLMWMGHVKALKKYYNCIVKEWIKRGYQNNMLLYRITSAVPEPWFIGNKSFHLSHQANLLRKDFDYYSKKFKNVPIKYIKYTYIWPSKLTEELRNSLIKEKNNIVDIAKYSTISKGKGYPLTNPNTSKGGPLQTPI